METWLLLEYGWARQIASEVIEGDADVTVGRVESIPPSPDREVSLYATDRVTGHWEELKLRTPEYDINREADKESKIRVWAERVKSEFERRRQSKLAS